MNRSTMSSLSRSVSEGRPTAGATGAGVLQEQAALRPAVGLGLASLLVLGLAYAVATTRVVGAIFPDQATGSLLVQDGKVRGSRLVAQPFVADGYFQSRPSAASYDPMAAAGSNMARTNPDLQARVKEATAAVAAREGVAIDDVPADLVTQSGGGLDPHLSPAAAAVQVARVAKARGMTVEQVQAVVDAHIEGKTFGVFGQPRVNVLMLNVALDAAKSSRAEPGSTTHHEPDARDAEAPAAGR